MFVLLFVHSIDFLVFDEHLILFAQVSERFVEDREASVMNGTRLFSKENTEWTSKTTVNYEDSPQ